MNAHARTRSTDAQYIRATKDRAARTRSCWPRGAVPCAACPVCVSASSRSRSTVRESGSGPRCHGSDGVLPSGRDRREAGGGAAAAADAPAAQSCRAGERWHTARRRRRPPRWLSLSSADAASRLGGGSCFAARVARRRTRLRSAAAARSERAGRAAGFTGLLSARQGEVSGCAGQDRAGQAGRGGAGHRAVVDLQLWNRRVQIPGFAAVSRR